MKIAVNVVDIQADFTEQRHGSLAVPGTDRRYLADIKEAVRFFRSRGLPIIGTQDWHPPQHVSFYTNHPGKKPFDTIRLDTGREQILWPPHCIQDTPGAQLLIEENLDAVIKKGTQIRFDSYSGFKDDGGNRTDLHRVLQQRGIDTIIIFGIATDYCVKYTALDGIDLHYSVILVEDLCRGVARDTTRKALFEVREEGVTIVQSADMTRIVTHQ